MAIFLGVGGFSLLGIVIYNNFRTRKLFFESLLLFCNHLQSEIAFSKNTGTSVATTYMETYHKSFRAVLVKYLELVAAKQPIYIGRIPRLKPFENAQVEGFFRELGRHGQAEELGKIKNKSAIFAGYFDTAQRAFSRDASTALKICIIMGVATVIILV